MSVESLLRQLVLRGELALWNPVARHYLAHGGVVVVSFNKFLRDLLQFLSVDSLRFVARIHLVCLRCEQRTSV
jgi:hypothetical protein